MYEDTHAHYLTALPTFAKNDDDLVWLRQHAKRYIKEHQAYSGTFEGQVIHILEDQSAVVERPDRWFDHFHYHRDRFHHVRFGPTREEQARWQYENFTNQDYAGIHDLTTELRDALRKTADSYMPGSKPRVDFLEVLEIVEAAHRRITHKNGAPVSTWVGWINDRQSWLDRKLPQLENAEISTAERNRTIDMSTMLAVAGPATA